MANHRSIRCFSPDLNISKSMNQFSLLLGCTVAARILIKDKLEVQSLLTHEKQSAYWCSLFCLIYQGCLPMRAQLRARPSCIHIQYPIVFQ
ncbi:hypothetical protein FGO68_gene8579 [Halteria grandinella]|uniref:Uncharacterized protein n=1 Tax=Halteria grandinella TaxID=5974 RepID=A0A8J8T6C5_HALGN|nr:hypothetical protein FGO68_gene8579 [Halteria grandinella]